MRQIQLIYLHVTAKRQLINRFRYRLNWHTFSTSNLVVSGEASNCNIQVNSQILCSHVTQTQAHQIWRMHITFWCHLPRWQFAQENRKTQTAYNDFFSGWRAKSAICCGDTQLKLLRILKSLKYFKHTLNSFLCSVRLMWRSACEECTFIYLVKKGCNYLRPCQSDSINLTITCLRGWMFR